MFFGAFSISTHQLYKDATQKILKICIDFIIKLVLTVKKKHFL